MPNPFHLVLEPCRPTALSQFMQWLLMSPVRRTHRHYHSSGPVWQGRFKSFPIQRDEHLLVVLRYVLQNPVRAGLVKSAREWAWCSMRRARLTDPCPVDAQAEWSVAVGEPLAVQELEGLRERVNRQRPFGDSWWQLEIARRFSLESTMRARGRPRKEIKK